MVLVAMLTAILSASTAQACACGFVPQRGTSGVQEGTVSDTVWQQLLDAGWRGIPYDGGETLFAPAPLELDYQENLDEGIVSGCLLTGVLAEDYSCVPSNYWG
jgi:hypothetical protein